ncbi:MAG: hypothetical protein UX17_C0009G0007 [Parcubacteria group bacterium GW2011_GWC2_45_7]|nr:MAG: hypothetical protein UX17_C0009G0007 [Parcubacteria group bacterium GW2011_GWC2_45_7]KKU74021.1 MAG: hypothetical protein UX98_C0002G0051 [Parcubacteria group bacterium GW2011_GWA2_47_26]
MFWILQVSENDEQESVDEQDRQVEFEKESQQMKKKRAKALEEQAKRAHERETAETPSVSVGIMKKGELLAKGCGTLLGAIPWIGIVFRLLFALARIIIKVIRVPLELAARLAARREEVAASSEAKAIHKELGTKKPQTESAHGGEGVRLPILQSFQGADKPKELFGLIKLPPQLYRFLLIMGIGLFVLGTILVIAASIAVLCESDISVSGTLKYITRYKIGIDCNF